ncbi:hypothetical protein U0070_009404 [Myodes glareolus]|uniref:Secreted protein n=1 Tax=Myodes glareolus TaxID=447135 RepID=A0AAW0I1C8_MYOGA
MALLVRKAAPLLLYFQFCDAPAPPDPVGLTPPRPTPQEEVTRRIAASILLLTAGERQGNFRMPAHGVLLSEAWNLFPPDFWFRGGRG